MKTNRKLLPLLAVSFLLTVGGCAKTQSDNLKIVCTIYPEYEWIANIVKGVDNVSTELLIDGGIDLHSYQPSVDDIAAVGDADLFVYVGGESDAWVESVLENKTNQQQKTINLLEALGDDKKLEEEKEGMQETEEHEHSHEHTHEEEYDEHVWNSLLNAKKLVQTIANTLGEIDTENKAKYLVNSTSYIEQLDALHQEYYAQFETATHKTQVVADRFPFLYLFDDYGLDYYAAFKGCSAESEASFETVIFLANKVDELGLSYILRTNNSDGKIADVVKENTTSKDQTILFLDSLETKPTNSEQTYLSIMENNLSTLLEACK